MRKIVLLLNIEAIYGGAERRLGRLLDRLSSEEDREGWIYFTGEKEAVERFLSNERLSKVKYEFFDNDFSCIRQIIRDQVDVLWFFNLNHLGMKLLLIPHRYRSVMTIANSYLAKLSFVHRRQEYLFKYASMNADFIDSLYPYSEQIFVENGIKNFAISPCPFTDLQRFFPKKKTKRIVFASRLEKGKNVFKAIESIMIEKERIIKNGYVLEIYGDGTEKQSVKDLIKEYKLQEIVTLKGFTELSNVLPYSNIFLSLQILTNYPSQVLLESIASGNYIIATNNVDTDKIVKKEFGCIVDNDSIAIAHAIGEAMDIMDSPKAIDVIRSARDYAEKKFSIENSIEYFRLIL